MRSVDRKVPHPQRRSGFTLVEMLVVVLIMTILMTAGAISLNSLAGKGVTSAVVTAEALFEEARNIAMSQRTRSRVLIAKSLTNDSANNLRLIMVVSEALKSDGSADTNNWVIANRATILPQQAFFSTTFSKKDQVAGTALTDVDSPTCAKGNRAGSYYYYEFNSEGIISNPGTSFVIGSGSRNIVAPTIDPGPPKVTASSKRDFAGFVVWKNGRTSIFQRPSQISSSINTLTSGSSF